MKRIDPLTGEEFIPKKISQKFATAENRILFNNKKASKIRQERAFLDKHINKNHLILREIYNPKGENIFNSHWLRGRGFRFDATNHTLIYEKKRRFAVYDFILIDLEKDDLIEIIKM